MMTKEEKEDKPAMRKGNAYSYTSFPERLSANMRSFFFYNSNSTVYSPQYAPYENPEHRVIHNSRVLQHTELSPKGAWKKTYHLK